MTKIPQDAFKILNFWQECLWQNLANELPLTEKVLSPFQAVTSSEIRAGKIALPFCQGSSVWIAPMVWEHSTKPKQSWIPLWIPAQYSKELLTPRFDDYPWIPPSQFDILTDNFLLTESIYQFEECLRFDWEDEEAKSPDWQQFYGTCFALLDALSESTWQERLKAKGYLLSDKSYVAELATLRKLLPFMQRYSECLDKEEASPILLSYAQIVDPSIEYSEAEAEEEQSVGAGFCGRYPDPNPLSQNEYQIVREVLAKEEGLFAIGSPVGSTKDKVMATLVASAIVTATATNQTVPAIYRLARYTSDFQYPIQPFSADFLYHKGKSEEQDKIVSLCLALQSGLTVDRAELSQYLQHELQLQYENYITGLNLLENTLKERLGAVFGKEGCPKQYLQALQQEDEAYELEYSELLDMQSLMQKKKPDSLFSRLFSWRDPKKTPAQTISTKVAKQYSTLSEIGDRIRQVKVLRAKIHLQLVTVTDKMATSKHGKIWQQWLDDNQLQLPEGLFKKEDLFSFIQNALSEKLWQLTIYYWLAKQPENATSHNETTSSLYRGWQLCKWQASPFLGWHTVDSIKEEADFIIIDEANRLLPQQVAPLLASVKKAIIFGDEKDLPALMATTLVQQEQRVVKSQLDDDEIIEQLHYKGMMISAGNAFQVALRNTHLQEEGNFVPVLSLTERKVYPLFQDFLYFLNYKKDLPGLKQGQIEAPSAFYTLDVKGKCEYQLDGCVNLLEAQAIIDWLKSGPYANKSKGVIVVTSFVAQKQLLKALLSQHQLHCEVSTFYQLAATSWDCVVFSPVYTIEEPRPFVFDQGDNWIYSLIVRAVETFWLIGDLRVFDPKMHSPSGCLAKVISMNHSEETADSVDLA